MERKTKIEIALAIAVVIVFVALIVMWRNRTMPVAVVVPTTQQQTIPSSKDTPVTGSDTPGTTTPVAPVVVETSAGTVARTFVERLGSYSSEADAENLKDLLPMATANFQATLQNTIQSVQASQASGYYGISTLVITAPKTVSATATQTVLTMTTQREETKGSPRVTTVKYQNITVTLVKSGTTWLVDGYSWKDGV